MEIDISMLFEANLWDRRIFSDLHTLTVARIFDQFGCKRYQKKRYKAGFKIFWVFFQQYFILRECQDVKNSFITYFWSTADVLFGWISRNKKWLYSKMKYTKFECNSQHSIHKIIKQWNMAASLFFRLTRRASSYD